MQGLFFRDFFLANQNESHVGKSYDSGGRVSHPTEEKDGGFIPDSSKLECSNVFEGAKKKRLQGPLQGPKGLYSWIFENLVWRPNLPRGESDIRGEARTALQPHSLSHEWLWLSHHRELSSIIPKINVVQRDEASSEGRAPLRLHGDRFPLGRRWDALYFFCPEWNMEYLCLQKHNCTFKAD